MSDIHYKKCLKSPHDVTGWGYFGHTSFMQLIPLPYKKINQY